jgi:glucokinase
VFLGVEIGGTKLQAAVGDGDGRLTAPPVRKRVDPGAGAAGVLAQLETLLPETTAAAGVEWANLAGVGVGFGGPVLAAEGRVVQSHQVAGWEGFPLAAWLRDRFDIPAALGNDSDLAGWAEATLGAGRGRSPVVYMNVGSGIGGALVIDGKLYQGVGFGAAEIGHLRFRHEGAWRRLEDLASGFALDRAARGLPDAKLHATAHDLVAAAQAGEPEALAAWNAAVGFWAAAVANVVTLLCPARFILGGGVALVGDFLFEPLRREVRSLTFQPFAERFEIVPAALGEDVVLHGALKLAREAKITQEGEST